MITSQSESMMTRTLEFPSDRKASRRFRAWRRQMGVSRLELPYFAEKEGKKEIKGAKKLFQ